MLLNLQTRVHDEGVLVEVPNVRRIGEHGHGVSDGGEAGPRNGCAAEIVVRGLDEKGAVACELGKGGDGELNVRIVVETAGACISVFAACRFPCCPGAKLGREIHIPCFSAYFNLFSLTMSRYPFPYLPSLNTVTITTGGLPDGLWYAGGACRLLPPRWNSHTNVRKAKRARPICFNRRLRIVGRVLVRGRKGGGFEDFRGGYAKCIAGSYVMGA